MILVHSLLKVAKKRSERISKLHTLALMKRQAGEVLKHSMKKKAMVFYLSLAQLQTGIVLTRAIKHMVQKVMAKITPNN